MRDRDAITRSTITLAVGDETAKVTSAAFLRAVAEHGLDARAGLLLAAARAYARRTYNGRAAVRAEPVPSRHHLAVMERGAVLNILGRFEVAAPDANSIEVAQRWLQEESERNAAAAATEAAPEPETPEPLEAPVILVRVPDQYRIDVAGQTFTLTYEDFVTHWARLDESRGEERGIPMPELIQRRAAALVLKSFYQRHYALDPSVALDGDVDERGTARYRLARKNSAGDELLGDWFTIPGLPDTHVNMVSGWIARAADALRAVAATKPDTAAREVALGRLRSSGRAADE